MVLPARRRDGPRRAGSVDLPQGQGEPRHGGSERPRTGRGPGLSSTRSRRPGGRRPRRRIAVRQLSLLRAATRADLGTFGEVYRGDLTNEDKAFLRCCGPALAPALVAPHWTPVDRPDPSEDANGEASPEPGCPRSAAPPRRRRCRRLPEGPEARPPAPRERRRAHKGRGLIGRPAEPGADQAAAPTFCRMSSAIELGTSWYEWNCIVKVARPWVADRTEVA